MNETFLLILTIAIALGFDVMNGFHDAANSVATVVSTRVLKPIAAVFWAAFFNLIAMVIFGPRVAETVAEIIKVIPNESTYIWIILCGLVGAILWDYLTWALALPTSSSHALVGGLAGAALAYGGPSVLHWETIWVIVAFIFLSPVIGFVLGSFLVMTMYWASRKTRPGIVDKKFRRAQLVSAALYSIGHGANDAQKTMGVIVATLIAAGSLSPKTPLSLYHENTMWIILSCQFAMSLGTFFGGWRIVKTMGMRLTKIKPIGGFSAETSGALTLFFATAWGIPVSTTHTITGAIIGVGSTTASFSHVRWQIAFRIMLAWILTLPGAGLMAALLYWII